MITMNSMLLSYFQLFRQGQLTVEALQSTIAMTSAALPADSSPRTLLEQTGARIDAILWGVCEAERDAHINDLLREIEPKLIATEP